MISFLFYDWFNVVPPWLRGYGIVDAAMIAQRLGIYGVINIIVVCIAAAYGFISRSRKACYSCNPLISIGILYILWLSCIMFLMVMEIRDEEGYRLALRWMPVFIICTIIGYASCIFILPNVYKSFARKESLAARILLSLFLVLSFPIYVKIATGWQT